MAQAIGPGAFARPHPVEPHNPCELCDEHVDPGLYWSWQWCNDEGVGVELHKECCRKLDALTRVEALVLLGSDAPSSGPSRTGGRGRRATHRGYLRRTPGRRTLGVCLRPRTGPHEGARRLRIHPREDGERRYRAVTLVEMMLAMGLGLLSGYARRKRAPDREANRKMDEMIENHKRILREAKR